MTTATKKVTRVGLDLGTNTSVFQASRDGKTLKFDQDVYPTIVGFSKPGIIPGILPTDGDRLYSELALEYRLHLDLKRPLENGFVQNVEVCRDFCNYLAAQINPKGDGDLWAVVGAPANASPEKQKDIRSACVDVFDRILVVPEPFLAAMGLRDEKAVKDDAEYVDPTKHSLIIDIGAGTTDCCLVQGYYPTAEDQLSINVAGDAVDQALQAAISSRYPDVRLTRVTITKMKEAHAFVGKKKAASVKIYVDGKPKSVDFGALIQDACQILIDPILECVRELLKRCDSEAVEEVLQNIIVAGGGSQIDNLPQTLQKQLRDEGYEGACTRVPPDYRRLVAVGALKIANNVREDQWQVPL